MKNYLIFLILSLCIIITSSCSNKSQYRSFTLPVVSKADENEEVFLQKKILINEMISASKTLHQISWPILKKNIDICENKRSHSLGILFADEKDLPESDSKFFKLLFNKNIKSTYYKNMVYKAFLLLFL